MIDCHPFMSYSWHQVMSILAMWELSGGSKPLFERQLKEIQLPKVALQHEERPGPIGPWPTTYCVGIEFQNNSDLLMH